MDGHCGWIWIHRCIGRAILLESDFPSKAGMVPGFCASRGIRVCLGNCDDGLPVSVRRADPKRMAEVARLLRARSCGSVPGLGIKTNRRAEGRVAKKTEARICKG